MRLTTSPPAVVYPGAAWDELALPPEKQAAASELVRYAFPTPTPEDDHARKGIRSDGVVVIQHGKLVFEHYARGYTKDTPHLAWSMTKSIMNALVGAAVGQGRLKLDDSICKYVPETRTDNCGVTVEHLLRFSSGLSWNEGYEGSIFSSTVLQMLYSDNAHDMAAYVASQDPEFKPGTHWRYSSGDTTLLARVLRGALGGALDDTFPKSTLFAPLGMTSAALERDGSRTIVGSSYLHATPRDLARFGYLYLHGGTWGTTSIVTPEWIKLTTTISPAFRTTQLLEDDKDVTSGAAFWLNQPVPEAGVKVPWPDVPQDAFAALGHWGQGVYVIPSLDVVIVRVADDRDGKSFQKNEFLKRVLAVLP